MKVVWRIQGVFGGFGGQFNEVAHDAGFAGVVVLIIRGQRKEGQGRPDDENGRHSGSRLFSRLKYKKRGHECPPILYANMKPLVNSYSL
jgi:hypothetical protein